MCKIEAIAYISDNQTKAKEIARMVIKRGDAEGKTFGDILQEVINKMKGDEENQS